ncbi:MmgE/PrpD family protein [uncultured Pigmentiphaga sp.]|uniref:MmgE/PrpD family protein n=1 Tax=uncultured Pigmentiphaga sp. TaxID=340361 RepID=UPI00260F6EC6|nr:MmgE/PrpD family protein [uncultured Pigmentiphaga sp.]
MVKSTPTMELASFAASLTYERLPPSLQSTLFELMLDYLRVASLGERMPWSRWAGEYVQETSGRRVSPLLFSSQRSDPASAAFLNTVYAGSIDADDTHVGAMLHPGCIVFSSALAIGQSRGISGARVLAAVAAGYEAMIRIALCIQPSHFRRGFQSTATCGVFGAAAAAAALLFPGDARRIAETLGLAASFSGGLVQFFHSGSTVKRIHAAQAARSGVQAALLAEAGFSGPVDILEGQDGFARAYSDQVDFAPLFAGLGSTYRTAEVSIKPHACSARVLAALEAAVDLCREYDLTADDIEAISLGIPRVIQGRLTGNAPASLQSAQMSAPFSVALAISKRIRGEAYALNVDDFEAGLADPAVMRLAALVECVVDEDVERVSTAESVGARLTFTLHDGRQVSRFVAAPKGSASRPYSQADHVARARAELTRRYAPAEVEVLIDAVRTLPQADDSGVLAALLG